MFLNVKKQKNNTPYIYTLVVQKALKQSQPIAFFLHPTMGAEMCYLAFSTTLPYTNWQEHDNFVYFSSIRWQLDSRNTKVLNVTMASSLCSLVVLTALKHSKPSPCCILVNFIFTLRPIQLHPRIGHEDLAVR